MTLSFAVTKAAQAAESLPMEGFVDVEKIGEEFTFESHYWEDDSSPDAEVVFQFYADPSDCCKPTAEELTRYAFRKLGLN